MPVSPRVWLAVSLACAVAVSTTHSASAQTTYTWSPTTTSTAWLTTANWSPTGAPGASGSLTSTNADVAVIGNYSTGIATNGIGINMTTASGVQALGAIDFNPTSSNSFVGGIGNSASSGNGVLLLNGATVNSVDHTLIAVRGSRNLIVQNTQGGSNGQTMDLRLGTTDGVFQVVSGRTLTIATTVSERTAGSGITVRGGGTVVLSGSNTYTGATVVDTGILSVTAAQLAGTSAVTVNANSQLILSTAGTYSFGSAHPSTPTLLTLRGTGTTATNGALRASAIVTLQNAIQVHSDGATVSATAALTLSGALSGSGTLTKNGAEQLTLGATADGYTGGLTVTNGTVRVDAENALGTGALTLAQTAGNFTTVALYASQTVGPLTTTWADTTGAPDQIIQLNGTGVVLTADQSTDSTFGNGNVSTLEGKITGTGAFKKDGTGNLTLAGTNTFSGGTTVAGGTLTLGHGTNTLRDDGAVTVSGGTLALGSNSDTVGVVTLTSGSITGTTGVLTGSSYSVEAGTVSATLAGAASLTKSAAGTVTLSGANTYTGATTLSGGVLSVSVLADGGTASGIGQSASAAANLVFDGGTLQYTGATAATNRGFTLNAGGGTIDVNSSAAALTVSGAGTGAGGLAKAGAGTLILTGANAYAGGTTIRNGTLVVGADNALPSGTVVTFGDPDAATSAILQLGGTSGSVNQTVGGLVVVGTATGHQIVGGNAADSTLTVDAATEFAFAGVIGGTETNQNHVKLVKLGAGTLTLDGTNTYTGDTTISGGTLAVNGSLGGSAVSVGGTLAGTGTVGGAVTAHSGGTVRPAGAGVGTLTVGGGTKFETGSALALDVADTATSDRLAVTGNLTFEGGAKVNVGGSATGFDVGHSYSWVIATTSGGTITGTPGLGSLSGAFTGADPAFFTFGTNVGYTALTLNYNPVPEPGAVLAVGAVVLGAGGWVRRRRMGKAHP